MRLSSLFTEGMVLQRRKKNLIWGHTSSGQLVTVQLDTCAVEGAADKEGYFEIELPEQEAGGPYKLRILGDEERIIENVRIGDVFLLGGQSNMELPLNRTLELYWKELKDTCEPDICLFELPKEYDFQEERKEMTAGRWKQAMGEDLLNFSALGYFTAKELKDTYGIPIGLLQTAVGGTPAKAWCSEKTIRRMGLYTDELEQCKQPGYPKAIEAEEAKREENWLTQGIESFLQTPVDKGTVQIPGMWWKNELEQFHGAIRLKKKLMLTKEQAEKKAEFVFGAIVDADTVMINGVCIGETGYKYPPRFYPIPEGILKEGENEVVIQMLVFRETGGFMPGKKYGFRFGANRDEFISLAGLWDYEIMKKMNVLPETTFFYYKAAGVYNGMLFPLRKWKICGCLYYQGESNVDNYKTYAEEMEALVGDWRALWKEDELPFCFVQLAGFSDGVYQNEGTVWAELRAAQEKTLSLLHTRMAAAYDIGEYNDLHPMNKKTLGERLARCIRSVIYKEDILCSGPKLDKVTVLDSGEVHLSFTSVGEGLCTRENEKEVLEVQLCGENGKYENAKAWILEDKVIVVHTGITDPKGVRYAWRDCPMDANLYNKEGLPALPFCREWE